MRSVALESGAGGTPHLNREGTASARTSATLNHRRVFVQCSGALAQLGGSVLDKGDRGEC